MGKYLSAGLTLLFFHYTKMNVFHYDIFLDEIAQNHTCVRIYLTHTIDMENNQRTY